MVPLSVALHGGAGATRHRNYAPERAHMLGVIEAARDSLKHGTSALDVAILAVATMEASGLYVAGRGASPNLAGEYELDACVIDGLSGRAGSVAALQGFKSPVSVARLVMDCSPCVMLTGPGAADFARQHAAQPIEDMATWFTHAGAGESNHPPMARAGTVGCVVRDAGGDLAVATSTAGVFGKIPGRVGDTPVIGAGAWADDQVAVCCTGQGEFFLRTAAAAQVAFRVGHGESLSLASSATLERIAALGGEGGLVAIARSGEPILRFISEGMKRAWLTADGQPMVRVFDDQ